jgi:sulfite exporter TauE/SafE
MEYILLFLAGLLSSMHCLGMCGCFVTAYSMNLKGTAARKAASHLFYSLGRITTYTFLGAVMGLIGSSMYFLGKMAGVQNLITLIAGLMMIYLGLSLAGFIPKIGLLDKTGDFFLKYTQGIFAKLIKSQGMFFTYPLGVTLGFLPCCLLYTVELQAMTTGSMAKGALSMFSFGLGTVPSLFSFGMVINIINAGTKEKLLNFTAYVIILLGVSSVYRAVFT